MASNLELSDLERRIVADLKAHPGQTISNLCWAHMVFSDKQRVSQAVSNLVSLNFISADENLRYVAVGGKL